MKMFFFFLCSHKYLQRLIVVEDVHIVAFLVGCNIRRHRPCDKRINKRKMETKKTKYKTKKSNHSYLKTPPPNTPHVEHLLQVHL